MGTSELNGFCNSFKCLSISARALVSLADLFKLSLPSGVSIGLMKASSIVDLSYGAPKNRTSYFAFLLSVVFLITCNKISNYIATALDFNLDKGEICVMMAILLQASSSIPFVWHRPECEVDHTASSTSRQAAHWNWRSTEHSFWSHLHRAPPLSETFPYWSVPRRIYCRLGLNYKLILIFK